MSIATVVVAVPPLKTNSPIRSEAAFPAPVVLICIPDSVNCSVSPGASGACPCAATGTSVARLPSAPTDQDDPPGPCTLPGSKVVLGASRSVSPSPCGIVMTTCVSSTLAAVLFAIVNVMPTRLGAPGVLMPTRVGFVE